MHIIINKQNVKPNKITCKGKIKIIECNNKKYVYKLKNRNINSNIYDYLESRNFSYYPTIIEDNSNYIISEYEQNYDIPNDQKILDMIDLIALLHSKTVQYKKVTEDTYKEIYESILKKINNLNNYFEEYITIIETKIFMSPSEYLLAKNISKIFGSLSYCNHLLEQWYLKVKDKKQIRLVLIHNNLSLEHFIKNKSSYLINWDYSKIDLPVIDLSHLYINSCIHFDFENILKQYEINFPLLEEEKMLLIVLISLPNKIEKKKNEYNQCLYINEFIEHINKSEHLVLKYNSK